MPLLTPSACRGRETPGLLTSSTGLAWPPYCPISAFFFDHRWSRPLSDSPLCLTAPPMAKVVYFPCRLLVIQVPVDLDGRVVLGSDQAVAPGAFFRGGEKHESEKTAEDEKKSILARGLREIVGMRLATATLPLARTPSPRRPGPSPVLRRAAKNRRAERLSWGRGGEGRGSARAPSPQRHAALRARPVVAGHLPLAWDVKIHVLSLVVDHGVLSSGASLRLLSSPSAFDSGPGSFSASTTGGGAIRNISNIFREEHFREMSFPGTS